MKHWIAIACALAALYAPLAGAQAAKPVVLRFASDFPGPPHPAGMAIACRR
jgi:hypothetical protein